MTPGDRPQPDTRRDPDASEQAAPDPSSSVLLLSGGLDSTALAALERPRLCVAIDYGQRSAQGELRAATAICRQLELPFTELRLDLGGLGGGLLLGEHPLPNAPSPEWWPFRNQILVTAAAGIALRDGLASVTVGSVLGDGDRHVDGRADFYDALDHLLSIQEGGIRVRVPAIEESTVDLLRRSGLGEDILGWTVSCHRASYPCGACPGCWKRHTVLTELGLHSSSA
jgi:7-cyano-7-deazaguanine synthase